MTKTQWYIGAPNGVILCIDSVRDGEWRGKVFHSYRTDPILFENTEQMTREMEALYDYLQFPHPASNPRTFSPDSKTTAPRQERIKKMSDEKLLSKHGDIGTFIVRVQHRQNSSWQGRITWMEEDKTIQFRSVWEMIKLIESAVDTVSPPEEDGEKEPAWFPPEE